MFKILIIIEVMLIIIDWLIYFKKYILKIEWETKNGPIQPLWEKAIIIMIW